MSGSPNMWLVVAALVLFLSASANALTIAYCSSENTGSSFATVNDHFQSNGACYNTCNGNYAFAILQGANCWCSNYAPADTTYVSSCSTQCPGFPLDTCGNTSEDLYGYIALAANPAGTLGTPSDPGFAPSSSQQTVSTPPSAGPLSTTPQLSVSVKMSTIFVQLSSSASSSSHKASPTILSPVNIPSPVTVLETVTASASVQVSTVSIIPPTTVNIPSSAAASTSPVSPNTPSTIISTTSTWTPSPYASVITVTGLVQTVTITPSAPPAASVTIAAAQVTPGGFFADTGKVVGVFVLVAIIVVAIVFTVIWCACFRQRNQEALTIGSNPGENATSRRSSKLSQLGFSVKRRSGDWGNLPTISTAGLNNGSGNEKSPVDTATPLSRRTSGPMRVVDQRLDPEILWNQEHNNGSHVSIRSFRDDRDYSRRMLRVANPDEEIS